MNRLYSISTHLKKNYRLYNQRLIEKLNERGFLDLRMSFLDVLSFICDNEGAAIKEIGESCGLKKQTMTSHLNELEKRGYIVRSPDPKDKRKMGVYMTEYGRSFKLALFDCAKEIEELYIDKIGSVELERMEHMLSSFYGRFAEDQLGSKAEVKPQD